MKYILFFSLFISLLSCNSAKHIIKNAEVRENLTKDSIVFITMKMYYDSLENQSKIEIIQIIKKPGTLKKNLTNNFDKNNYLSCILFHKENIIDSFCIAHPLYKDVETLDNDNSFQKKSIRINESEFFIRFEKKDCNSLVIKEKTTQKKEEELIIIEL